MLRPTACAAHCKSTKNFRLAGAYGDGLLYIAVAVYPQGASRHLQWGGQRNIRTGQRNRKWESSKLRTSNQQVQEVTLQGTEAKMIEPDSPDRGWETRWLDKFPRPASKG